MAIALLILMAVVIAEGLVGIFAMRSFMKWLAYVIDRSSHNGGK